MPGRYFPGRVPVIRRPSYTVFIEYIPTQPGREYWVHCTMRHWSASSARALDKDFNTLIDLIDSPVHVLVDPYDGRLQKFVELFGFEEISRVELPDGTLKRQYVAQQGRTLKSRNK